MFVFECHNNVIDTGRQNEYSHEYDTSIRLHVLSCDRNKKRIMNLVFEFLIVHVKMPSSNAFFSAVSSTNTM